MIDKSGFSINEFYKEIDLDQMKYAPVHVMHGDEVLILDQADVWYALKYLMDNAGVGERSSRQAERMAEENERLKRRNEKLIELVKDLYEMVRECDSDSYPSDWKKDDYLRRVQKLGIKVEVGC